jgi:hypothetical protein
MDQKLDQKEYFTLQNEIMQNNNSNKNLDLKIFPSPS